MKKRNGFTLIELLAVIVILAIIAVIATPIIVGIIEDSRKAAFERSVEGIIHATDIDFGTQEVLSNEPYTISNGVLNKTLKTPIKNIDGFNGKIVYDEKGNSTYAIYNDKWCMKKTSEGIIIEEYNSETCKIEIRVRQEITKKNGQPIYFDVVNGVDCTNYHPDNSKTGYNGITTTTENQTSCLKLYAFLYNEGDTEVNLLLDHNTTERTYWAGRDTANNANGPIDLLTNLKTDTSNWVGTLTPEDYIVSQTGRGNYTIDYDNLDDSLDYKAMVINADEIAKITGAYEINNWRETTADYDYDWYFFDSLSTQASYTCKHGDFTGCRYAWLTDDSYYWTSTSAYGNAGLTAVWVVYGTSITYDYVSNGSGCGVRLVIEVPVSNL